MAGTSAEPRERVGVIFVHGIGQQGAFEHLENSAADLILALREREKSKRITAGVNTTADASFRAMRETWRAEGRAPILVDIKDKASGEFTRIELREVWWADLGEDPSLLKGLLFLWWGCTLWATRTYKRSGLDGFGNMFLPRIRSQSAPAPDADEPEMAIPKRLVDRILLLFFAMLFLLVLPTWALLGTVMRLIGIGTLPTARILLQYFGDVKLYGQRSMLGNEPIADIGTPPRVAIRRRFVKAMLDTAMSGYDRWYVVAHSLGSVVALNGLVESEQSLPNYLDEERWQRWTEHCRTQREPTQIPANKDRGVDGMWPARPAWLGDLDGIDRRALFKAFRGLLTYGSPLGKFAVLFPATVPLNRDRYVFPKESEWINIYEPTDPVGASLGFFGPFRFDRPEDEKLCALAPTNYAVATWPIALWSHVTYFRSFVSRWRGKITPLADALQIWIILGQPFESAVVNAGLRPLSGLGATARKVFRLTQIVAFFLVTLVLCALGVKLGLWAFPIVWAWFGGAAKNVVETPFLLSTSAIGAKILAVTFGVVFVLGVLAWLFGSDTQRPERKKMKR